MRLRGKAVGATVHGVTVGAAVTAAAAALGVRTEAAVQLGAAGGAATVVGDAAGAWFGKVRHAPSPREQAELRQIGRLLHDLDSMQHQGRPLGEKIADQATSRLDEAAAWADERGYEKLSEALVDVRGAMESKLLGSENGWPSDMADLLMTAQRETSIDIKVDIRVAREAPLWTVSGLLQRLGFAPSKRTRQRARRNMEREEQS